MSSDSSQTTKKQRDTYFRMIQTLLTAYMVVGWLGFATVVVLSLTIAKQHPSVANTTAWVHGLIVALTGLPFIAVAKKAAQSKGRAETRLRIILTVVPIAFIAVIFFLPLPKWMDAEQGICAALLLTAGMAYYKSRQPQPHQDNI